jgi:AcrR family transcriptional regulator
VSGETALKGDQKEVKGKGRLKREATEAALIDAFTRVVQRSGLRSVGVNEVIKEAGIGKSLLYRYFGGLPGLVKAWGEKNQIWPDLSEFHSIPDGADQPSSADLLKRMVLHHASSLREDPLRVEILADQFMNPTPISEALQEIRQQLGAEHQAIFGKNKQIQEYRVLMMFLMSAASFLAMRAVKAPWYMGENIATDEGWDLMMGQLEQVIDASVK